MGEYVHNFGGVNGPMMFGRAIGGAAGNKLSQNLNANFSFQHTSEDEISLFPDFGGKDQLYQSVISIGYSVSEPLDEQPERLLKRGTGLRIPRNYFTGVANVAGTAGIQGVGLTPFFYGLPTLNFSGYGGGVEQQPSSRIQQVAQLSDSLSYIQKDHNLRMGADIRRIFIDVVGGVQGTGYYTFSGFATEQPGGTGEQGNSFADFLIGIPQQGKLQAPCAGNVQPGVCDIGSPKYLLRENEFSLYAQDTWRATPTLTLLYGLRYDTFALCGRE